MKNATNEGAGPAEQFRALLQACKVPAIRALKKAGMAASTPFRWEKEGKTPKAGQVDRLRMAVLELAEAAGTLPLEHAPELAELRDKQSNVVQPQEHKACPRQILRRIQSDLRELDTALASQSPAP